MSSVAGYCGQFSDIVCKVMVGFTVLTYSLINHQLDIISRHFAVAFSIPIHNIGIYFNKLYSLRCLFFVISGLLENAIFHAAGGDKKPNTSMMVPIEAFPFGIHDAAFMALASEYVSIVSMFFNFGRLFVLGVQWVLDLLFYSRPLLMIKIQGWITVIFTTVSVIFWCYYNFDLKVRPGQPTDEQIIAIVEKPAESAIDELFKKMFPDYYAELIANREKIKKDEKFVQAKKEIEDKKNQVSTEQATKKINEASETEKNKSESLSTDGATEEQAEKQTEEITKEKPKNLRTAHQQMCDARIGNDGIGAALSPVMMYWSATIYKDFLYPGTLPYGLLARDKCHLINMLMPFFNNIGPLTFFFMDNFTDKFDCWSWPFDLLWILYIPLPIIFVYVFLAIHTKIPSARAIINSRPRIMAMTLMMIISFGYMDPVSYIGVGKYAFRGNPHGFAVLGFHINAALLCRSIFARLSVGYTDVRISLGYHLPKFRPTHKMSDANTFWYIFKNTFKTSWKDVKGDFKMDIKKYL